SGSLPSSWSWPPRPCGSPMMRWGRSPAASTPYPAWGPPFPPSPWGNEGPAATGGPGATLTGTCRPPGGEGALAWVQAGQGGNTMSNTDTQVRAGAPGTSTGTFARLALAAALGIALGACGGSDGPGDGAAAADIASEAAGRGEADPTATAATPADDATDASADAAAAM